MNINPVNPHENVIQPGLTKKSRDPKDFEKISKEGKVIESKGLGEPLSESERMKLMELEKKLREIIEALQEGAEKALLKIQVESLQETLHKIQQKKGRDRALKGAV